MHKRTEKRGKSRCKLKFLFSFFWLLKVKKISNLRLKSWKKFSSRRKIDKKKIFFSHFHKHKFTFLISRKILRSPNEKLLKPLFSSFFNFLLQFFLLLHFHFHHRHSLETRNESFVGCWASFFFLFFPPHHHHQQPPFPPFSGGLSAKISPREMLQRRRRRRRRKSPKKKFFSLRNSENEEKNFHPKKKGRRRGKFLLLLCRIMNNYARDSLVDWKKRKIFIF